MAWRRVFGVASAILVAATGGCDPGTDRSRPPAPGVHPATAPSPALTEGPLPRIDVDGLRRLIAEADAADQVLVIDFWATWCDPCVALFPGLHEDLAKLPGVRLASATFDSPGDREAGAFDFLRQHGALHDAYLVRPDSDAYEAVVDGLGREWKHVVVPAILVYDRAGRLAGEFLDDPRREDIVARVRDLLSAPPPATAAATRAAHAPTAEPPTVTHVPD